MKDHVEINGNPSQAALAAENIQRLLGGSRGPAVEKERGKLTLKNSQNGKENEPGNGENVIQPARAGPEGPAR